MPKLVHRRAVVAGTVVALLVVTGGYVVAASLSGLTITQTGQNAGSITTPTDTIFASDKVSSININLVQAVPTTCGVNGLWSGADPPTSANLSVFMDGTAACTDAVNEWFEELTWIGVTVPGVHQNDTFFITVSTGDPAAYTYVQFNVQDTTTGDTTFTGQLNVFLAAGPDGDLSLPVAYNSISIAVSGT